MNPYNYPFMGLINRDMIKEKYWDITQGSSGGMTKYCVIDAP